MFIMDGGRCARAKYIIPFSHTPNFKALQTSVANTTPTWGDGAKRRRIQQFLGSLERKAQPNIRKLAGVLQECCELMALSEGKRLHQHIVKSGHAHNLWIANNLINFYGRCGQVEDAYHVFHSLPNPNSVSWNVMIAAYAQAGKSDLALELFWKMLDAQGNKPNKITFLNVLKACGGSKTLEEGKRIHAFIRNSEFDEDLAVQNALMNMYSKSGSLEIAVDLFDRMAHKDLISWNTMISACAENGEADRALQLFKKMQQDGKQPDKFSFLSALDACSRLGNLKEGQFIHSLIAVSGLESDVFVGTALIDMYGKCGNVENATEVFRKLPDPNVVSWNALIGAYAQIGHVQEAIAVFQKMSIEGLKPTRVTFLNLLCACMGPKAVGEGRMIHDLVVQHKLCDLSLGNALINMYKRCGSLEDARRVFNEMPKRDVISWSAILAAYAESGYSKTALQIFKQMHEEGVTPNKITFLGILEACTSPDNLEIGRQIHLDVIELGLDHDVVLGTALISMYGRCGSIEEALQLFNKLPKRDLVTWNAVIAACSQQGHSRSALQLFELMQKENIHPNSTTLVSLLSACATMATPAEGIQMHSYIINAGFQVDVVLGTALVDMYGKCGSALDAHRAFDEMPERDVASWNALMAAHAQHGSGKVSLQLFQKMHLEYFIPDKITFIGILNACSHAGLVEEGYHYFSSMDSAHRNNLSEEHYGCMVDLLGRAGYFYEATEIVRKSPYANNSIVWMTLLSACRGHEDLEQVRAVTEQLLSDSHAPALL